MVVRRQGSNSRGWGGEIKEMVCDEGEKNIYILHRHEFGWGWGEVLEVLSSVEVMGIEGHQIWVVVVVVVWVGQLC